MDSLVRLWERGRSVSFAFWSQVLWVWSTEETLCKVQQENPQTTVLHFSPHKKRPTDLIKTFASQSVDCDKGYRKAREVSSHGILVLLLPTQVRVSILVEWCRLLPCPFSFICLPSPPPHHLHHHHCTRYRFLCCLLYTCSFFSFLVLLMSSGSTLCLSFPLWLLWFRIKVESKEVIGLFCRGEAGRGLKRNRQQAA